MLIFLKNPAKIVHRPRLGQQEALGLVAADLLDESILFFRLHPFSQRKDVHFLGNLDQTPHELAVGPIVVVQVLDELHVDLDQVKVVFIQAVQAGVARAKVIHPELKAQGVQVTHLFPQLDHVA